MPNLDQLKAIYGGELRQLGRSPDTVKIDTLWVQYFEAFLKEKQLPTEIDSINLSQVSSFISNLQQRQSFTQVAGGGTKRLSPFTVNQAARVLRTFGNWLERNDWPNPFKGLKIPSIPKGGARFLNDTEIEQVLALCNRKTHQGARNYAIIALLLSSGIRVSEAANAKVQDLDINNRRLRVFGKGSKWRVVSFGVSAAKALLHYQHAHRPQAVTPKDDQNIFLSVDGYALGKNGIQQIVKRIKRRTGIVKLSPHVFRHTFAVKYLLNGGDIVSLQNLLGHEDISITRRYLNLTNQQVAGQHERFDPLDRLFDDKPRRFGQKHE